MSTRTPYQVVICGGGVAALEAAAALREHAGDRVALTLIAPEAEFVYRPLVPASAFGYPDPPRVALDQIAAGVDATLIGDRVSWIDRAAGVVHTDAGAGVAYDALIVCVGATARVVYEHALTIDGRPANSTRSSPACRPARSNGWRSSPTTGRAGRFRCTRRR